MLSFFGLLGYPKHLSQCPRCIGTVPYRKANPLVPGRPEGRADLIDGIGPTHKALRALQSARGHYPAGYHPVWIGPCCKPSHRFYGPPAQAGLLPPLPPAIALRYRWLWACSSLDRQIVPTCRMIPGNKHTVTSYLIGIGRHARLFACGAGLGTISRILPIPQEIIRQQSQFLKLSLKARYYRLVGPLSRVQASRPLGNCFHSLGQIGSYFSGLYSCCHVYILPCSCTKNARHQSFVSQTKYILCTFITTHISTTCTLSIIRTRTIILQFTDSNSNLNFSERPEAKGIPPPSRSTGPSFPSDFLGPPSQSGFGILGFRKWHGQDIWGVVA